MSRLKACINKMGGITFLVIFFSIFLSSCMQSKTGKRTTLKSANTSTGTKETPKIPDFKEGNNFIQNGIDVFTSVVNFDISFSDSLQLRGKDVDNYIRNNGTQTVACLTSRFTDVTVNKIIVLAAIPRSVYNFSTLTLEYYYNISPADSAGNQNFCQKTGLINQLNTFYPGLTQKYKVSELCPGGTCISSTFYGSPLELYTSNGVGISQIATKQLLFSLTNNPVTNPQTGITCTETSYCVSQGYDCCSSGQCVSDLSIKPGIDTLAPDYLQALQDILNNPANIYLYPQYYFICSQPVNPPTTPTTPTDPTAEALKRLERLKNLFNCTTKINGEYGVCTKTHSNITIGTAAPFYAAGTDDRSFFNTFTNIDVESDTLAAIEEISIGEVVVYDYSQKTEAQLKQPSYEDSYVRIEGNLNDDLATGTNVRIKSKPSTAVSNDLVIKYKTDASCVRINSTLAKCEKHYVQGQKNSGGTDALRRQGRVTDHYAGTTATMNSFKLPYYANTSKAITVDIDGITLTQSKWELKLGATNTIDLLPVSTLNIFQDQKIRITFFVDLTVNNVMSSKLQAQGEIKQICSCADLNCSLTPVKNTADVIVDYACVYPDPIPTDPPMSQKVYVSSKAVPVRFFDDTGISRASVNGTTRPQEGKAFSYRKSNLLNPSNMPDNTVTNDTADSYTGFNEIYGSLSYTNNSAKPAHEVSVKKGSTYDIYVDRGSFSNCIQCGNDYYSQLNKLFPLAQFGGGIEPLRSQTNRTMSNGVRSDELSFGRSCMVPATMLPWSHATESSGPEQRVNRMRAQHFLFANGYQKDWYGFDYGSVIGSFDGVKWFSIGTNRRIKAESNKMFIAVNAIMGDLTLESTYEVSINDASLNPTGANVITNDFDSDGAQCQRYHQCSTDNDCATTLGWDYACAPVGEITTSWPVFDDNGKEVPEAMRPNKLLTSILGIASAGKRCVYRGRGAVCNPNHTATLIGSFDSRAESNFSAADVPALRGCSANNYCQTIATNGVANPKFNNRIVRYGKVRTDATVDNFGLGALVPGRPYAYNPSEQIRTETLRNLNANKTLALCMPGRDIDKTTFVAQNQSLTIPDDFKGDRTLGIGMSFRKVSAINNNYLASCSIQDSTGNFYHFNKTSAESAMSTNSSLRYDSGTQAISTNALNVFNSIFNQKGITFGLYKNNTVPLSSVAFTENRCLRAPGSSCFSDLDCAPSKTIADKIKTLSGADTSVTDIINAYEVKFWQEELVCSQTTAKTNALYDPKNNRCCREVGKTISIASADLNNALFMNRVPGIDDSMSERFRYSRAATVYGDVKRSLLPELRAARIDQCSTPIIGCEDISVLTNQYKTFSAFGERTSCSGDWIRNFSNGTHKWEASRFQSFSPALFKCLNWLPGPEQSCAGKEEDDPTCLMTQTSPFSAKAKGVFSYLARLELMGIPQIALESQDHFEGATEGDFSCRYDPADPTDTTYPGGAYKAPQNLFASGAVKEYKDGARELYSAGDATNFLGMKQIFKADEIVGCHAAGTTMPVGSDPALCCTGMINAATNKCQLNDYVDVSVYTNRYVSSEAKKLNASLFDQYGYVKDPSYVAQIACEKQMCASGTLAYGILISKLKTPGQEGIDRKYYRFLEGSGLADNANDLLNLFNRGLKINTHAYCVPAGMAGAGGDDLTVISCGN